MTNINPFYETLPLKLYAKITQKAIITIHAARISERTATFFLSPAFANFTMLPIIHGIMNAAISDRYCSIFSINQSSQFPTVLGKGRTSLIFETPVRYITHLSNPSPKPACLAEPYFLMSR